MSEADVFQKLANLVEWIDKFDNYHNIIQGNFSKWEKVNFLTFENKL